MQAKKQSVALFYAHVFLYTLLALLTRLAALAPLCALFAFPAGSAWRRLWLLCPALIVFWVLPQRFSFAEALVQPPRSRFFSFDTALSMKHYGAKLLESLLHALNVLKWGLPLAALGAWGYSLWEEHTPGELLGLLNQLGKQAVSLYYGVIDFFRGLFGRLPTERLEGGYMQGLYAVLGLIGLGLLILLYGAVRNSATRYIWAVAERSERPVRTEIRRRLRGRRVRQLLVALVNLALFVPFLAVAWSLLKDSLTQFTRELVLSMTWNGVIQPKWEILQAWLPMLGAFLLLYLPLLPARRILTAAFASRELRHAAPKAPVRAAKEEADGMPAAIVPDWVRAENDGTAVPETPVTPASFTDEQKLDV